MPYCFPSYAPGSASPFSQSAPCSSSFLSLRSSSPPLSANWATWVLPASITSGASLLARAAVIFWPMPSHSWIWILTSMSGCAASKPVGELLLERGRDAVAHQPDVDRRPPPGPVRTVPGPELQALRAAAVTSADTPASKRYFTVHLNGSRDLTT